MDYAGGIRNGAFYLQNDGFFNDYTPAGTLLSRPDDKADHQPDIDLSGLP
jgi:hypothetical protein